MMTRDDVLTEYARHTREILKVPHHAGAVYVDVFGQIQMIEDGRRPRGIYALRQWLKRSGMTEEEFAGMLGVRRETVSRWFNKQSYPSPAHCVQIYRITGVIITPHKRKPRWRR